MAWPQWWQEHQMFALQVDYKRVSDRHWRTWRPSLTRWEVLRFSIRRCGLGWLLAHPNEVVGS